MATSTNDRLAKLEQQFEQHIAQTARNFEALSAKLDQKIGGVTFNEGQQAKLLATISDNVKRLEKSVCNDGEAIQRIEVKQKERTDATEKILDRLSALEMKVTASKVLVAAAAALGAGAATAILKLLGIA